MLVEVGTLGYYNKEARKRRKILRYDTFDRIRLSSTITTSSSNMYESNSVSLVIEVRKFCVHIYH